VTNFGEIRPLKINKLINKLQNNIEKHQKNVDKKIYWFVIGTSPFRRSSNGVEVFSELIDNLKVEGKILSSHEEGKYSYKGVQKIYQNRNMLVVDFGGGSTEITKYEDDFLVESINFGTSDIRNIIGSQPVSKKKIKSSSDFIKYKLNNSNLLKNTEEVVFCGGTARNYFQLINNGEALDRSTISKQKSSKLETTINELSKSKIKKLKRLDFINPYRAEVLLPGLLIMNALIQNFGYSSFKLSPVGLREGFAESLI
jgi:exopolyphosphatase/guanosine-5'-triphosphate,3'-diphosphate pyrophosphatase